MSSLIVIALSNNYLTGSLPSNCCMSIHPRLEIIYLLNNQLSGRVPSCISHCINLRQVTVENNQLSGTMPAELGSLQELRLFSVRHNQLTGKIPYSFGNLTKLTVLALLENRFEGEIPKELGNLLNLQSLLLGANNLTSLPTSLLNLSTIREIDVSRNQLTGTVPATLGEYMPQLVSLRMANNSLKGSLNFLKSLSHCKNLTYIGLSQNEFEGSLPNSIGNLSVTLEYFYAWGNHLNGRIPTGFANLTNLLILAIGMNELTGTIPLAFARLVSLQILLLEDNKISGSIPSEIGELKSLSALYLQINHLYGVIPDSMGNLTGLQQLSLAANRLSSSIPLSLWSIRSLIFLNLSQNALVGSISGDVSNLNTLDKLDLSKNQLSGNISSALGRVQMLTYLDLSKNSFSGQIPQSLGELINIVYLNLSKNFLSGIIPKPLAKLRHIDSLDLSFNKLEGQIPEGNVFSNLSITSLVGNMALCGAPQLGFLPCFGSINQSHSRRKLHLLTYILPVVALVLLVSCMYIIFRSRRRRNLKNIARTKSQGLGDFRIISIRDLVHATNNFCEENLLGRGGFGSVFKGYLDDGLIVAVKVLNLEIEGASKSFDVECQALCQVRHRNLIKIISVCFNLDFKALILQYMPNGSLDTWLHSGKYYLNILQRLNIMMDVSSALEYLHHQHHQVVLHCDLKPSNILLDEDLVAHVSDFGIAKLVFGDNTSIALTSTPGTVGYIPPEYASTGRVSKMGDVYSFGVLLLETFTGKKPTDEFDGESNLREFVSKLFPSALFNVIDGSLLTDFLPNTRQNLEVLTADQQCLSSVLELGLLCSSYLPKDRMSMIDVMTKLEKIKAKYLSQLSCA